MELVLFCVIFFQTSFHKGQVDGGHIKVSKYLLGK